MHILMHYSKQLSIMIAVEVLANLASDPNIPTPANVYLYKNRSLVLFNKVGE